MPSQKSHANCQLPTLEDIQMDPASAYYSLTGEYRDSVTESEVYDKLLDVMEAKAQGMRRPERGYGQAKIPVCGHPSGEGHAVRVFV